jgi:hypothetical protein
MNFPTVSRRHPARSRAFALLLWLYPRRYRRQFGADDDKPY